MHALNWISTKIGVEIIDTPAEEFAAVNHNNNNLSASSVSFHEQNGNPFEQDGDQDGTSSFHSFSKTISPSSRYVESEVPDKFSTSPSPFLVHSAVQTPSPSPRKGPYVTSTKDGLASSSQHYQNFFQGGGGDGGSGSENAGVPLYGFSSSGVNAPFGYRENNMMMMGRGGGGVEQVGMTGVGMAPLPSSSQQESTFAHQAIGQLVNIDSAALQAKAAMAKEKMVEISHVAQERVIECVSKASSWMEGLQGVVKKKVYNDWWKDATGGAYEFSRFTNDGPGVNNEVDANGLPVSKNWYVYNEHLGRWDVTPDAPVEVQSEFYQQLQAAEEAKQRREFGDGIGRNVSLPPPPPPPPPSSGWFPNDCQPGGSEGAAVEAGGGRGAGFRRAFTSRGPQYAVSSYFSPGESAAPFPLSSATVTPSSESFMVNQPSSNKLNIISGPFPSSQNSRAPLSILPVATSSFLTPPPASTAIGEGNRIAPAPPFSFPVGIHTDPGSDVSPMDLSPPQTSSLHLINSTQVTVGDGGQDENASVRGEVPSTALSPTSAHSYGLTVPPPPPVINVDPAAAAAASVRCHPNPLQALSRKGMVGASRASRPQGPSPGSIPVGVPPINTSSFTTTTSPSLNPSPAFSSAASGALGVSSSVNNPHPAMPSPSPSSSPSSNIFSLPPPHSMTPLPLPAPASGAAVVTTSIPAASEMSSGTTADLQLNFQMISNAGMKGSAASHDGEKSYSGVHLSHDSSPQLMTMNSINSCGSMMEKIGGKEDDNLLPHGSALEMVKEGRTSTSKESHSDREQKDMNSSENIMEKQTTFAHLRPNDLRFSASSHGSSGNAVSALHSLSVSGATTMSPLSNKMAATPLNGNRMALGETVPTEPSDSRVTCTTASLAVSSTSWSMLPPPMPSSSAAATDAREVTQRHDNSTMSSGSSVSCRSPLHAASQPLQQGGAANASTTAAGGSHPSVHSATPLSTSRNDTSGQKITKPIPPPPPPPTFTPFIAEKE